MQRLGVWMGFKESGFMECFVVFFERVGIMDNAASDLEEELVLGIAKGSDEDVELQGIVEANESEVTHKERSWSIFKGMDELDCAGFGASGDRA